MGFFFEHASGALPSKRLAENQYVVAFYHPRPSYETHILIVPKRRIPDLLAFDGETLVYAQEAILMAQRLVRELELEERGYRFIVNGGNYQDVRQVHWHLVAGPAK